MTQDTGRPPGADELDEGANTEPPSPLIEPLVPPPALQPPPALPRIEDVPTEAMPVMQEPAPTEAMPVTETPSEAATELLRAPSPPGVGDAPIGGDVDADALEAVFADDNFREYAPEPLLVSPTPVVPQAGIRASGPDRAPRPLLWLAGSLAAVLVLIGLFFLGTRIPEWTAAEPEPTPTVEPTPEPEPEPEPDPLEGVPDGVPLPAGDWEWSLLRGGECIEPWVSPWEEQFTVVDCAEPHAAQLILRNPIADAPEEFPGIEAIASPLSLVCSSPQVLDYTLAAAYDDVQIQTAYPVTAEEWDTGYRDFFCFISRAGGGALEGDLSLADTAE